MASPMISEELRGVDALCRRWANEVFDYRGGCHPIYRMVKQAEGAALPAGEVHISDEVMVLDRILASSDTRYHAMVKVWYCYSDAVQVKAKKLSISRDAIYDHWRRTLEYLKGRLHGQGVMV